MNKTGFLWAKKPDFRFRDYVDPIHSHDTRWFLTLSGCHAGDFRASGVFGRHSERIYLWKTWFFDAKSTDFPQWVQGLAEVESGRKINGSRPSEGAQRATGDQIQQKPSRNFISGPVSPPRDILGGLEVETDLNLLMYILYKSFKVPRQRSPQSFGCLTIDFVVSGTDLRSEYLARGPQMLLWTSKTVSMSPVKCTRPSVCIRGRQSHDPIFGEGGGQL